MYYGLRQHTPKFGQVWYLKYPNVPVHTQRHTHSSQYLTSLLGVDVQIYANR